MDQHNDPNSGGHDPGLDPSMIRGLTQSRLSRRQLLRSAGAGAGALGVGAFLAACGVKGATASGGSTPAGGVGTAAWWAKQKLHHTVNFANWPYYIDVLKGKHPSLEYFTKQTGITVNYTEPISDNLPFYAKIRPSLQAKQSTGFDIIVMTNNSPPLGYLINFGWLTPLDRSMMSNFNANAGPLVKNPSWDPGNKYTMAWQSGWTAIGYNSSVVKNPGTSVGLLFDKKYAGKVGMMADPQELGSLGLLAIGVEPATSTESDWAKAAKKLQQQKSDGIVRAYYDQDYINHLKNGDTVVTQAWSGDIFQADLNSKYRSLKLLIPSEGGMFWTDNMCIPMYAQNPKDAMTLMDFYYQPQVEAVVEYYDDYVCPVPGAKNVLLNPTGWAKQTLTQMKPEIGLATSVTAKAPTVFPTAQYVHNSKSYYEYKSQEELTAWNNLFLPITQGA
ncbi:MAG TPA: spermidine/putrescine ABC transporter substrate-binding protein [Streptosporangiaceae bacterium]|jgi:spermidine/putrescine transport system substrate-binding protein|nr:spermidine/putrescine ABC transporter substrate-binding protein [Streptosporangiaceae bacterium]